MRVKMEAVWFGKVGKVEYTNNTARRDTFSKICVEVGHSLLRVFIGFHLHFDAYFFGSALEDDSWHGSEACYRNSSKFHKRHMSEETPRAYTEQKRSRSF